MSPNSLLSPHGHLATLARRSTASVCVAICLILVGGALSEPALADDRDLFALAKESPYVMMMLDTSGSMNAQLAGSTALGDQANPGARFYQAKAAVYDVVKDLDPRIRLGLRSLSTTRVVGAAQALSLQAAGRTSQSALVECSAMAARNRQHLLRALGRRR